MLSIRFETLPRLAVSIAFGLNALVLLLGRTAHAGWSVTLKRIAIAAKPHSNLNSVRGGARDDSLRNFRTALNEISQETHSLLITEGTPLVQDLDDARFAELQKSIAVAASNEFGDKLPCVASAFDYDVVRFDDRTFLLRKRYRNSYELPLVTYEELAHSVRSILYVLDSYSPAPPQFGPTALNEFYASLTPEQKQQAKNGISVGKLNEAQRRLAAAVIERLVLETRVGALRETNRVLADFTRSNCSFKWFDANGANNTKVKAFGYAGNFGVGGSTLVRPLSPPFESLGAGGYTGFTVRTNRPALPGEEKRAPDSSSELEPVAEKVNGVFTRDPTVPNRLDRVFAATSEIVARTDGTLTLRQAARYVLGSDHAANAPANTYSPPTSVSVNDAIAEKPVNVFGLADRGDARHFLKALAQVYGLQLLVDAHNHYQITLPQPHIPDSPEGLPSEISRLTPPPLLRAHAGRASVITAEQSEAHDAGQEAPTTDAKGRQILSLAEYEQRRMTINAQPDAVEALYFCAARRLIAAAEPLVPTAASAPIPVEALAPESNRLVGLSMFCQVGLIELVGLQRFVPPEILLSPERAIVQASSFPSGDDQEFGISFGHLRDDGKLINDGFARGFHSHSDGISGPKPQSNPPLNPTP